MIPTLLGIMILNFVIIHAAPGGPVEKMIARFQNADISATARFSGGTQQGDVSRQAQGTKGSSSYRGAQGLDPEFIAELERQFGFDKPPL